MLAVDLVSFFAKTAQFHPLKRQMDMQISIFFKNMIGILWIFDALILPPV